MQDVFWNGFADELEKLGGDYEPPRYRRALASGGNLTPGGDTGAYADAVRAGAVRMSDGRGLAIPASIPVSRWTPELHRKVVDTASPRMSATPEEAATVREALGRAANAADRMRYAERPPRRPTTIAKPAVAAAE